VARKLHAIDSNDFSKTLSERSVGIMVKKRTAVGLISFLATFLGHNFAKIILYAFSN
jgi:hypothetical protein